MPGRSYTSQSYRYGFNGQEKVDEIAGVGNHTTALFWEYDTRLGRRWNQDPRPNPSISNYATFANNPNWFSDPLGDTVRLEFNGDKGEITVYANTPENPEYQVYGVFPAHNRTAPQSQGKWEDGTYEFIDKNSPHKHGEETDKGGVKKDSKNGMYGSYGNYRASPFTQSDGKYRSGMAVHSGRTNDDEKLGWNTYGCIRVSECTMTEIQTAIDIYGRMESITVIHNLQRSDNQEVTMPYLNQTNPYPYITLPVDNTSTIVTVF